MSVSSWCELFSNEWMNECVCSAVITSLTRQPSVISDLIESEGVRNDVRSGVFSPADDVRAEGDRQP